MPHQHINDIELFYELTGDGDDTIVLVHGGWTDHLSWQFVVPAFAERHRVLAYDRRGHSRSRGPGRTRASRRQHELDLAALIETLDLGVVNLVGNSYGGSIALGLASRRPDLVQCVIVHEPPLLDVAKLHKPLEGDLFDVRAIVAEVSGLLQAGDAEGGARLFVEQVLGTGTWQMLPEEYRRTFVANADTFLDMTADSAWAVVPAIDGVPMLLTDGDASPSWLPSIVGALASTAYPHAGRHTFAGAGHVPHLTDPEGYATIVQSFLSAARAVHAAGSR
jgi:pimeloyl-ACP methyl ester carboxylesterase